ncbi:hypothetical protein LINGRAHAP2_LOCUS27023, partial [Linum grandiflorum]
MAQSSSVTQSVELNSVDIAELSLKLTELFLTAKENLKILWNENLAKENATKDSAPTNGLPGESSNVMTVSAEKSNAKPSCLS